MKQEQIISVLYDLTLTACSETRVAPLLTKMTQRLLYHTAFSCGFFFSYSDQEKNNRNSETIDAIIKTALCSRQLNLIEGKTIKVPRIFSASESKIISDKEFINTTFPNNKKYNTVLTLPVPSHGAFVLLSQADQDQALPLTRIFTPVLDNFSKTLSLCKQNEEVTHALEREVEERKKAEQGLSQFKKTMDMMHDCVFVIDPESLRFIYCNHGAVQQTGYSMEELLAMTPADIDPNNDIDAIRNMMNKVMARSDISVHFDAHIKGKNGKTTPVNLMSQYVAPDNEPSRIIIIAQNITEQKKTHNELLKAKNDAEHANQAKSTFLSRMSHELRTPMNAILGFSQLLNMEEINPQQHQFTNEIMKAGNHLLDLINDILDLSKIESGNINISMEELDLKKVIAECLPLISPLATKNNITINNLLDEKIDLCVKADFTRTKQVALNLLSNAIKYNRKNGSVCISAEHINSETIRVIITDTGSGIAPEYENKLFIPFERLHASNTTIEGTGIGLNISKRLIEAMNGRIGYQNNQPENSTFWFELKRCEEPRVFSNTTNKCNNNTAVCNEVSHTILYVEDNPANLRLMERIIELRTGAKLISAHTASMGIDLARHHLPDIILMDISLPDGMDGFQALHTLQRLPETNNIPVIAISANAMPREIEKGKQAGFYDYLAKPVDINKLSKLLDQLTGSTG